MKSLLRVTVAAMLSAVMFVSCATTGAAALTEKATEMTPENSVVMIFVELYAYPSDTHLVQINPAYPAGKVVASYKNGGATEPLLPGACYMIYYPDLEKVTWAGIPSIDGSIAFPYLNATQTNKMTYGHRIEVPAKPGLYVYYPEIDIDAIKESNAIVIGKLTNDMDEWHKIPMYRKNIQKCFIKASKAYAGTAWEPLIDEYVEEWSE